MNVIWNTGFPICAYKVLDENDKEYKLEVMGWVPKSLLVETDRTDLIAPIDLLIEVSKIKNKQI